jgi:hypothetical protein
MNRVDHVRFLRDSGDRNERRERGYRKTEVQGHLLG